MGGCKSKTLKLITFGKTIKLGLFLFWKEGIVHQAKDYNLLFYIWDAKLDINTGVTFRLPFSVFVADSVIVILKFPTRKDSLFFSVISLHTKVQTIKLLKWFFSLILLKHIKVVYLKSEVFTSFLTNSSILDCPAYLQLQKSSRALP